MIAAAQEPSGGVYVDDSLACYLHDVSRTPRLTPEQEIELGRRIAEGDTTALRQLVEANLRLVVSIAKHYQNEQLALLDLVQEGNLGLITAARKFDYRLGFRFSTYAVWWIRQSISRAIANHSQAIRLPVHVTAKVARLRRQVSEAGLAQGDGAAEKEADPPTEEMLALVHRAQRPLSLERILSQPDDVSLIDAVEDKQAIVPLESAEENALHDQLNTMLDILPDHQRRVIELRFGLSDGRPRTLREVGSEIGLTRERIRQLEMEALGRLRRCGMAAELYGYLH